MVSVNIHDAKTNLSRLIEQVLAGEEIVISKAGKPVARLVPYSRPTERRKPGLMKGKIQIRSDFDQPLPEDLQDLFCNQEQA